MKLQPIRKYTAREIGRRDGQNQLRHGMKWHYNRTGEQVKNANTTPLRKTKNVCTVKGF